MSKVIRIKRKPHNLLIRQCSCCLEWREERALDSWTKATGEWLMTCTPTELRAIADCIERKNLEDERP